MEQIKKDIMKEAEGGLSTLQKMLVEELDKALGDRAGTGVKMGDVEGFVRKVVLEKLPPGKRTETETRDKPTEGPSENVTKAKGEESLQQMFKKMMDKKANL